MSMYRQDLGVLLKENNQLPGGVTILVNAIIESGTWYHKSLLLRNHLKAHD